MATIKDVLKNKGGGIYSISPDQTVYEAIQLLSEKKIGALLVIDQNRPVGIISERDYARKVILAGRSSKSTRVKEIMTGKVICIDTGSSMEEAMAIMTNKKIRHLPVMENNKCVGMISLGDLVKHQVDQQKFMIDQLVKYISNEYMA